MSFQVGDRVILTVRPGGHVRPDLVWTVYARSLYGASIVIVSDDGDRLAVYMDWVRPAGLEDAVIAALKAAHGD